MIRRSAKLSSDHQKDFCLSDYSDLPDFRCVVDPKKDFLTVCGCRIICQQAVFSVAETNSLPPQTVKKTFLHSLLVKKTFLDSLLSDHLQTSGSPVHIWCLRRSHNKLPPQSFQTCRRGARRSAVSAW